MPSLKHAEHQFSLREIADTPDKLAPNILLVHGLTFSSHQFDVDYEDYSLARFLARNGYRVWLLDLTGYGRSEKPQNGFMVDLDYAVEDIKLAATYIRKHTANDKIDVLGWSTGTITAARFTAQYPNWVNKLILYAPIYQVFGVPVPVQDYQPFSMVSAQGDMPKIAGTEEIDYQKIIKPVVDLYTQQCITYDGAGSPTGIRRDFSQSEHMPLFELQKLTMPVLMIAGTADTYLDFSQDIPKMRTTLPNKYNRYCEIKDGSHILMLEKQHYQHFQKEIFAFLNSKN